MFNFCLFFQIHLLYFQILSARNLVFNYAEAPDTYVDCYIKDSMNDKIRQKKKTDIVRQNINPDYNYRITYAVSIIKQQSIDNVVIFT